VFTAGYGHGILTLINLHLSRLLPRRPGFDDRPVRVKFVVGNVALEQVFLRIFLFSPVRAIPVMLLTHVHLKNTLMRTENGRYLEI